ncbi:MAG TPA: patatin-like phospholipase family protein [Acholeplasmataceae bacterium]|nr:patatin-like phospholipase family protein [Acholeplasmataceae bacterium]
MSKLGLCLTGGGARGAYQAGAIRFLHEVGLLDTVDLYAGTSIGAANASVLVSKGIDGLENVWFNIPEGALKHEKPLWSRLLEEKLKAIDQGIYSMDTFSSIMMQHLDQEKLHKKRVFVTVSDGGDDSKGLFGLVKTSYSHYIKKDSQVMYLPLDELTLKEAHKAVIASCSIPVVFPAVKNDHRKYYDGGVFDNIPIRPLIDAGCDVIILIHLNRTLFFKPEDYPHAKIHEIKHKGSLGGVLDFSKEHIDKIYQWGYQDAQSWYQSSETIKKS